jgi:Family of unknown function (DUF6049)
LVKRIRLAAALVVLCSALALAASGRPAGAGPGPGPGGITLLSQTPYVNGQGTFKMRLRVDTAGQPGDYVQVLILPRLVSRTEFQGAVSGKYDRLAIYQPTAPVAGLSRDPSGGVDIEIPFNVANPPAVSGSVLPQFPSWYLSPDSVYPLQLTLYNRNNQPVGNPLNTFVVYSRSQSSTGYSPLSVAVVLPVTAAAVIGRGGQVGRLPASESQRLSQLVGAVASESQVRVNLEVTPEVLDALAVGDSTDQATLSTLRRMVQSGQAEVFPATYVQQPIAAFLSAGLGTELDTQMAAGDATFLKYLGVTPSRNTWLTEGPLDGATVSAMTSRGATQLIAPDGDLTDIPPAVMTTIFGSTYAWGTQLSVAGAPDLGIYAADPSLTVDFNRSSSQVMAVNDLLAEIAMIQVELPGLPRGIVVMPPPGWMPSTAFVSTLLGGLAGDPTIQTVAASQLFDRTAQLMKPLTRNLAGTQPPRVDSSAFSPDTANQIQTARNQLTALASVIPGSQPIVSQLEHELLLSEAGNVPDNQRNAMVRSMSKAALDDLSRISLPDLSSITLTSTKGSIPLTILAPPSLHAQVQLVLKSQKLLFEGFVPPDGQCQVFDQTSEICTLNLVSRNTTLKVPVQSRSPGAFQLTVSLYSPNGAWLLAQNKDTVRSTAISNVGIVLIVVTLLSLAIWWVRDLRHGRRARQLVPSPIATDDETLTADPVVDAFFAQPPPELPDLRDLGGLEGVDDLNDAGDVSKRKSG